MHIRLATKLDKNNIRDVHSQAFPDSESPMIAELSDKLLLEDTTPPTVSLIAEIENAVVGHIAFSPVRAKRSDSFLGYILAPLGVTPDQQKMGIGSQLVKEGLKQLLEFNTSIVFVYGDPNYYGRFGFSTEAAQPYIPPYKLQYPFGWQALSLNKSTHEESSLQLTCVPSLGNPDLW